MRPARPRDAARLLVVGTELGDRTVRDLPTLLRPGDLLVFNDTRVIPAQLQGLRGEARVSITLHQRVAAGRWRAFAQPARRLRAGDDVSFGDGLRAHVLSREGPQVELDFARSDDALRAALTKLGKPPLPPYIRKQRPVDAHDEVDYQTMFAAREGAVAAPTAGLHFTARLLEELEAVGVSGVMLTLHVGAGTFLPVVAEDTEAHRMHAEWGTISAETATRINEARRAGGRIIAVGTTCLRLLESAADETGQIAPFEGETDIFITPGYRFRAVDMLLTNFHLPRSTLFMLVAAFAGLERMRAAYEHAKGAGYRFYSYGDACLLHRHEL